MRVIVAGEDWGREPELEQLLYDVLYRDFDVARDASWRHAGARGTVAVALDANDRLLGSARLLPAAGDPERQLRQLAVAPDARGRGVGCALVRCLEDVARAQGANAIVLNARDTAFAFYERLGYRFTGKVFVSELTGIAHRPMRLDLLG